MRKKLTAVKKAPVREQKKITMIRVDADLLARIDKGAKRLGLSRSAFVVSSAAEKLDRMDRA